jgi:hypothetical protein
MDKVYSQATSDACKASMRHILFLNKPIGATADNSAVLGFTFQLTPIAKEEHKIRKAKRQI